MDQIEVLPGAAGRTRFRTLSEAGDVETVEEFDQSVNQLHSRQTRRLGTLGKPGPWVVEIGDAKQEATCDNNGGLMMVASSNNPIFARYDTPRAFEWRVRNLSWPAEVYSVEIDQEARQLVIRTTNKKYFKRFDVRELDALGLPLECSALTHSYHMNTLVIHYEKPSEVLQMVALRREQLLEALAAVPKAEGAAGPALQGAGDGQAAPGECKQQ
eukprot:TRINITY_DN15140_c0_g1_i2.p1 TRINITY_DN15140_c0_g1~~TRINITY_DN15140_c0_g1_i2.p1  ORF type:complete len:214 (-),score=49.50 TRINITY_DN15140_c0_g1_i2:268-909(-)